MAPAVSDELASLASASDRVLLHEWDERSLGGFAAVVAATPNRTVNEAISRRARPISALYYRAHQGPSA